MADRVYDAAQLALQGAVSVALSKVKKGDRVVAVVECTLRAFEDKSPAHQGDTIVAKARTGAAIVLTGAEADALGLGEQLDEVRRAQSNGAGDGQGELAAGDDYDRMSLKDLRALCKERGYSQAGGKKDLAQRLRDNG